MAITVGKKWDRGAEYIGRGSPLGNPYAMKHELERDHVCDQYEVWFKRKVDNNDPVVMTELRRLYRLAQQGPVVLGCFCAPRRCHGNTIKNFLTQFVE